MKKIMIMLLASFLLSATTFAGYTNIALKKGSVLVYSVKEGKKAYTYTVTVQQWEGDNTIFAWQTNEKPKPRKGTITLDKYYSLGSTEFLTGIGKAGDEKLTDSQTRLIVPSVLNDYILEEEDDVTFTVNENGKTWTITNDDDEIEDYLDKKLNYNNVSITGNYTKITSEKNKIEIGLLQEINDFKSFLAYYKSEAFTMDLISIKTDGVSISKESAISKLSIPASPETKVQSLKMDATKLAAVTRVYPVLAKLENYDVTNGGKDPKPFSETYDFRISSGAANPPSAIDCFTSDLQILYNQKKNYGLADMTETISKNKLPSSAAQKLMGVYLNKEARNVPGYKPWTHWKFVRSLSETQRNQLAIELEGYIKQYGFTE